MDFLARKKPAGWFHSKTKVVTTFPSIPILAVPSDPLVPGQTGKLPSDPSDP